MQRLKEMICRKAAAAGHGVIKVDFFMNHQVDAGLMLDVGKELAQLLGGTGANKVLTVETGGIVPAFTTALALGVPLIIARKRRAPGMSRVLLNESTLSQTRGEVVDLFVSPEFLTEADRVILIDDFLTNAQMMLALSRLVAAGGGQTVGIGVVVEKTHEGGRAALDELGVPVEALVRLGAIENGHIQFLDD